MRRQPLVEAAETTAAIHAVQRLALVAGREPNVHGVVRDMPGPSWQAPRPCLARASRLLLMVEVVEQDALEVDSRGVTMLQGEAYCLVDVRIHGQAGRTRKSLLRCKLQRGTADHLRVVVHGPDEAIRHRPPPREHLRRQIGRGVQKVCRSVQQTILPLLLLSDAEVHQRGDHAHGADVEERGVLFPCRVDLKRRLDRVLL
mmetsp:Transcript_30138/g.86287  ORF Transcript_30138/g.86287 Transcript_30138/m.86287 type:complete len:201 (+) Transcript_30138:1028-1630(+)